LPVRSLCQMAAVSASSRDGDGVACEMTHRRDASED